MTAPWPALPSPLWVGIQSNFIDVPGLLENGKKSLAQQVHFMTPATAQG